MVCVGVVCECVWVCCMDAERTHSTITQALEQRSAHQVDPLLLAPAQVHALLSNLLHVPRRHEPEVGPQGAGRDDVPVPPRVEGGAEEDVGLGCMCVGCRVGFV